jgi:hypothetical protein
MNIKLLQKGVLTGSLYPRNKQKALKISAFCFIVNGNVEHIMK